MKFHWKLLVFAVLFIAAVYGAWYGSAGWDETFVNERTFSMPFGWVDWGQLISWSFFVIFFFALGLLMASLFRSSHSGWWTLGLGAAYGLFYFQHSVHFSQPSDTWATYFFTYGTYFMPPLGALCGSAFANMLSRRKANRVAA